jgi:hypothetical protein
MRKRARAILVAAVTTIGAPVAPVVVGADAPAQPQAARAQDGGARPLLKQLNEETQSLYNEVQAGVVRVQLPPPKWAGGPQAAAENPVQKWGDQLDPAIRQRLEQEQKQAQKGQYRKITAQVESAPATSQQSAPPATQQRQQGQATTQRAVGAWTMSTTGDELIFRPNGTGAGALRFDAGGGLTPDGQLVAGGRNLNVSVTPAGSFTPNNIGLLLDAEGHILVPICVEKDAFDAYGVRVMVGPGQMTVARFVGSDRQTNITLLKLDKPLGTPVKVAADRPREGTLTMFLAPNSGVGRLVIWNNEIRDWGVVVGMDGGVHGFTRNGQFLSAAGCKPATDQLIKSGAVRRAKIGLAIVEVPQTDPRREADAALGTRPAVRVSEIAPDSAAARAGLQPGDFILRLNDQSVGDPSSFAAAMSDPAVAPSVKYLRDGVEQSTTIELPRTDR